MLCCLFKKRRPAAPVIFPSPSSPTNVSIQCGRCKVVQAIPTRAVVFVCSSCHCVNRVYYSETTQQRRMSYVDCDISEATIIPNTPALFQLGDVTNSKNSSIPICSVCLDGVGDMILDTCQHGGICEECARHIAMNKAVGGSHCPKCRTDITQILRIGELHSEFAKVRHIVLPGPADNAPPRVPPPVGYRKEKGPETTPAEQTPTNES